MITNVDNHDSILPSNPLELTLSNVTLAKSRDGDLLIIYAAAAAVSTQNPFCSFASNSMLLARSTTYEYEYDSCAGRPFFFEVYGALVLYLKPESRRKSENLLFQYYFPWLLLNV